MSNTQTTGTTETVRYANIKALYQMLHQSGEFAVISHIKESRKQIDALLSKLAKLEQAESENLKREEQAKTVAKAQKAADEQPPVEVAPVAESVAPAPAEEKPAVKPEKDASELVITRSKTFSPEKKPAPKACFAPRNVSSSARRRGSPSYAETKRFYCITSRT